MLRRRDNGLRRRVLGDADHMVFVATGGGARLPIIKRIAEEGVEYEGNRVAFIWRDPAPEGMAEVYPDLVDPYPQIAVAVGGALPSLPEQGGSFAEGIKAPPRYVATSTYKKYWANAEVDIDLTWTQICPFKAVALATAMATMHKTSGQAKSSI